MVSRMSILQIVLARFIKIFLRTGYETYAEAFLPDVFLFDKFSEKEPNIDTDLDGTPDTNLTIDFVRNEETLEPSDLIFFNISLSEDEVITYTSPYLDDDGEPIVYTIDRLNIPVENPSEQLAEITLLNHDYDYDGIPDLNYDLDNDGIAETAIDSDGDFVPDFSQIEGYGKAAVGATVELTALSSYPFGDVYGQTLPESVITATTNNFGVFNFTFIDDGQNPYIGWNKIKIVKDRGDKLVWNQSIISIAGSAVETNIGTFSLTSAPLLVGVRDSIGEHYLNSQDCTSGNNTSNVNFNNYELGLPWMVGSTYYGIQFVPQITYGCLDFSPGTSWDVTLFFEDITALYIKFIFKQLIII